MLKINSLLVATAGLLAILSRMPSGHAAPGSSGNVIINDVYYDTYLFIVGDLDPDTLSKEVDSNMAGLNLDGFKIQYDGYSDSPYNPAKFQWKEGNGEVRCSSANGYNYKNTFAVLEVTISHRSILGITY